MILVPERRPVSFDVRITTTEGPWVDEYDAFREGLLEHGIEDEVGLVFYDDTMEYPPVLLKKEDLFSREALRSLASPEIHTGFRVEGFSWRVPKTIWDFILDS